MIRQYKFILISIFFGILISVISAPAENDNKYNEIDIFKNQVVDAQEIASEVIEHMENLMDSSVDPCDDFIKYATGGNSSIFNSDSKNRHSAKDKRYFDTFFAIANSIQSYNEINFDINKDTESLSAEEKFRIYYSTCLKEEQKETTDFNDFLKLLEPFGSSPLWNSNWKTDTSNDWMKILAFATRFNIPILFRSGVKKDLDKDKFIHAIVRAEISYNQLDEWIKYEEFIKNVLELTGIDKEIAKRAANEIVEIETELSKINLIARDENVQITLEEIIQKYPNLNWKQYFSTFWRKDENSLDLSTTIDILSYDFLEKLDYFVSESKPETITNFVVWRILKEILQTFDQRYKNEFIKFQKSMGTFSEYNEEKIHDDFFYTKCFNEVLQWLYPIPGVLFINKHLSKETIGKTFIGQTQEYVNELANHFRKSFEISLQKIDFNDTDIKNQSIDYLKTFEITIGRPQPSEIEKLNELYKNLKVTPSNYLENWLNARRFEFMQRRKNIQDINDWRESISNVYEPRIDSNMLSIPVSDLIPPNYHLLLLHAHKYAALGTVIASTIIKGIPFIVSRDPNWTEIVDKTEKCIGKQTKGYFIADNILKEMIALKKSFESHNLYSPEHFNGHEAEEYHLSDKKIFFIHYVQNRVSYLKIQNLNLILALTNVKEFAETFNCPVGSKMNPKRTCYPTS